MLKGSIRFLGGLRVGAEIFSHTSILGHTEGGGGTTSFHPLKVCVWGGGAVMCFFLKVYNFLELGILERKILICKRVATYPSWQRL